MKVNIGCGEDIREGYVNVDIAYPVTKTEEEIDQLEKDGTFLLLDVDTDPLHWFSEGEVEEIVMIHVIEHLKNPLFLMENLHRIAKPDCPIFIACPHGGSDDAWEDPTHKRPYFPGSFNYFSQPFYWRADYGYTGDWVCREVVLLADPQKADPGMDPALFYKHSQTFRNTVLEMRAVLSAVKQIRERKKELQRPVSVQVVIPETAKPPADDIPVQEDTGIIIQ